MENEQLSIYDLGAVCRICNGDGVVKIQVDHPRRGREKIDKDSGDVYFDNLEVWQKKDCMCKGSK
jgi:hypothetical protein